MKIQFIDTLKREIARLLGSVEAAKGASAQIEILRGTIEMLEDVEKKTAQAEAPKTQVPAVPMVPRFEDTPEQPGTAREAPSDHQEAQPAAHSPVVEIDMAIAPKEPEAVKSADGTVAVPKTVEIVLTDAATLTEPLTQRQFEVFNALWKLHSSDIPTTVKALTAEAGFPVADAIDALVKKRYAKRSASTYPLEYHPIATGTPRVGVPPKINGNATGSGLENDPAPGRSALDKKRAIDELNPVGILTGKGHACKRITSDTYLLDRNTVSLKTILEQINIYRTRANLPSLDLTRYL